jgi:hypothetical protein
MPDFLVKILREFGFPTLFAVVALYFAHHMMQEAEEARARWEVLMQYVMDLPADCRKP